MKTIDKTKTRSTVLRAAMVSGAFFGSWFLMGAALTLSPLEIDDSPDARAQALSRGGRNLLTEGNIKASLLQAKQLLREMRSANWDVERINPRLLRVPDQNYAPVARLRVPGVPTFLARKLGPTYENVAFYSSLYVRRTERPRLGKEADVRHEGFLIVGWKNGHIEQVPIRSVRIAPKPGDPTIGLMVWPGLAAYSEDLPAFGEPVSGANADPPKKR